MYVCNIRLLITNIFLDCILRTNKIHQCKLYRIKKDICHLSKVEVTKQNRNKTEPTKRNYENKHTYTKQNRNCSIYDEPKSKLTKAPRELRLTIPGFCYSFAFSNFTPKCARTCYFCRLLFVT